MIPSGKFDVARTPLHDIIQLWVSNNACKVIRFINYDLYGWGDIDCKYLKLDIEKPLYNGSYLQGIVDGVVDVGDIYDGGSSIFRRAIYEIKPKLDSLSGAIGQIKSYAKLLKYGNESKEEPDKVIITSDNKVSCEHMESIREMLSKQGIELVWLSLLSNSKVVSRTSWGALDLDEC